MAASQLKEMSEFVGTALWAPGGAKVTWVAFFLDQRVLAISKYAMIVMVTWQHRTWQSCGPKGWPQKVHQLVDVIP